MQNRLVVPAAVLVSLLSLSSAALAQDTGHPNQTAGAANAQTLDPHDLSGLWVREKLTTTVPPMTAEGKAKLDANKPGYGPRSVPPALGNDPIGNCDPLGMPRLLLFTDNRPIEFLQTPGRVTELFQFHESWRTIWTDGRKLPDDPAPLWMGYSIGHWDGDTFVVESTGFDERTWLDHFGDPHSDEMRMEERWRRIDHDTMDFTMTVTDPKIYTTPWVTHIRLKTIGTVTPPAGTEVVQVQKDLIEEFCVPSEERAFNKRIRDLASGKHD
jgi:hypothetical protein